MKNLYFVVALLVFGLTACSPEAPTGPDFEIARDSTVTCDPAVDPQCEPGDGHIGPNN